MSAPRLASFLCQHLYTSNKALFFHFPSKNTLSKPEQQKNTRISANHGVPRTNPPHGANAHNTQPPDPDPRARNNPPRRQLLPQPRAQPDNQRHTLPETRRLQSARARDRRRRLRGKSAAAPEAHQLGLGPGRQPGGLPARDGELHGQPGVQRAQPLPLLVLWGDGFHRRPERRHLLLGPRVLGQGQFGFGADCCAGWGGVFAFQFGSG